MTLFKHDLPKKTCQRFHNVGTSEGGSRAPRLGPRAFSVGVVDSLDAGFVWGDDVINRLLDHFKAF